MLLTTKDLQKTLNIGRDRAYALMRASGFPSIRINSRYYIEEPALQEWLRQNRYKEFRI